PTTAGPMVIPEDKLHAVVNFEREKPPEPARVQGLTLKIAPPRDDTWTPPAPTDAVPPTPDTFPTTNHALDSVRGGENNSTVHRPIGGDGPDVGRPAPNVNASVMEIDFRQMTILSQVAPFYPPMARMTKTQGEVVLLMTVDVHGIPTDVKALSGPHPSLELEAMRAARLWRFVPASMNGQAVAAQFRLTILFKLK
ncbi:MAG: energy transducer TonB, partial [Holophaga sp.]|nr:energy transducer TonB [Holophaga sp.]